ncbi:MAG: TlyA family RNA methyltransferase [Leptospiraceae bacterium]|nr:TlyA family RNA methyltransferase [Leptospiraceae bacterium]MCP5499325.1 TlyA family RNA methyltransferase [Leptospiraceae bacterium]
MKKKKLKDLLLERGLCDNEQKARSLILSGSVLVNEIKVNGENRLFKEDVQIRLLHVIPEYVSRGAYKLLGGFEAFPVNVQDKICLDLGASTGGFTEILLANGARKVYAFDVGYGQLAGKLRNDPRVVVHDRFHIKNLSLSCLDEKDISELFIVMDLSFISLKRVFPTIQNLKLEYSELLMEGISLLKPQFECKGQELEKGIVRDPRVHFKVIRKIWRFLKNHAGVRHLQIADSPIRGNSGNREFLLYWKM